MNARDDAGFGCSAFGHLASACVDGELPASDLEAFATHLPGCAPCQRLSAEHRALDIAAQPAFPVPTDAEWNASWGAIRLAIETDRVAASTSPAVAFFRRASALSSRAPWLKPTLAAAAALGIIGLTLALRQAWPPTEGPTPVARASATPGTVATPVVATARGGVLDVTCQPGWESVVWTIGGDTDAMVVQCRPVEI